MAVAKYKVGQIRRHKISGDKVIITEVSPIEPYIYSVRKTNWIIIEGVSEFELEPLD